MMATNSNSWAPIPVAAMHDPRVVRVGKDAELAYYRSLLLSKSLDQGGAIPRHLVAAGCLRGMRRHSQVIADLIDSGLWLDDAETYVVVHLSGEKTQQPRTKSALTAAAKSTSAQQPRTKSALTAAPNAFSRTKPDTPAKVDKQATTDFSETPVDPSHAGARAHVSEREREDKFRSPSGSDRNLSARAAPRSALTGATRPAPERENPANVTVGASPADDDSIGDHDPEGGNVIGLGELSGAQLAKANIRKLRSTGRPAELRRPEWQDRRNEPSGFDTAMAEIAKRLPAVSE